MKIGKYFMSVYLSLSFFSSLAFMDAPPADLDRHLIGRLEPARRLFLVGLFGSLAMKSKNSTDRKATLTSDIAVNFALQFGHASCVHFRMPHPLSQFFMVASIAKSVCSLYCQSYF